MATDQSPPRHKLILVLALGTVASLFVLKFVFDSYFIDMMETEAKAKIAKPEELWKVRDDENKRLTQSPVPIDQAMQQIGRGREASPLIAPQQSNDNAPLVGWARLAQAAPEEAGDAGEQTAAIGDAGSQMMAPGDAGHMLATDAGALDGSTVRHNQGKFPGTGNVNPQTNPGHTQTPPAPPHTQP